MTKVINFKLKRLKWFFGKISWCKLHFGGEKTQWLLTKCRHKNTKPINYLLFPFIFLNFHCCQINGYHRSSKGEYDISNPIKFKASERFSDSRFGRLLILEGKCQIAVLERSRVMRPSILGKISCILNFL